jgi:hypothetical protein
MNTDEFIFSHSAEWVGACEEYQTATDNRTVKSLHKRFLSGGVLGVALITLRHQRDAARIFWNGVFDRSGLSANDPRCVLYDSILTRTDAPVKTVRGLASMTSLAWEKWATGQKSEILRIRAIPDGEVFSVYGTPYRPMIG